MSGGQCQNLVAQLILPYKIVYDPVLTCSKILHVPVEILDWNKQRPRRVNPKNNRWPRPTEDPK